MGRRYRACGKRWLPAKALPVQSVTCHFENYPLPVMLRVRLVAPISCPLRSWYTGSEGAEGREHGLSLISSLPHLGYWYLTVPWLSVRLPSHLEVLDRDSCEITTCYHL